MNPAWCRAGLLAATLAGCGRSEPTLVVPPAPHGGTVVGLPDGLGGVEVVREEVAGTPGRARLVLYFLDAAGQPAATAPTAASLRPRGRGAAAIPFRPLGADPAAAGALASAPVAPGGDIDGELEATIGARRVAVSINVR